MEHTALQPALLLLRSSAVDRGTSPGSSSAPTATSHTTPTTPAPPGILAAGVWALPPARLTGILPTAPPRRTPSAWARRSSVRGRSATGQKGTVGGQLVFFPLLWVGSGQTGSTLAIGR